jgi:hypothetical protein
MGFPEVFENEAGLAAAYRFFNNQGLCFETLIAPHVRGTLERAGPDVLLSLEDTTTFTFGGAKKRQGLGRINTNDQGFLGHFALLAKADGSRAPLGMAAAELWVRSAKKGKREKSGRQEDKESQRWERTVGHVEAVLAEGQEVIHVQDREGDIYSSLASMVQRNRRFVVRCIQNRRIAANERGDHSVYDTLEGLPVLGRKIVQVSARPGSDLPERRKTHPPRKARTAEVVVTATAVTLRAPDGSPKEWPPTATINVVHVFEPSPPSDEEPIEWILATTEPIATCEDVMRVVDIYATRWLIEEFFKAIKTGCAYEKRQLETYHALTNALAACIPIACEMLALRTLERTAPNMPASDVLDPTRIEVLRATAKRYPLPDRPTVRDALVAIAGMGGFLKRNGRPGWLTLRRGYTRLLDYEELWRTQGKDV